jgi:hypothetical protein
MVLQLARDFILYCTDYVTLRKPIFKFQRDQTFLDNSWQGGKKAKFQQRMSGTLTVQHVRLQWRLTLIDISDTDCCGSLLSTSVLVRKLEATSGQTRSARIPPRLARRIFEPQGSPKSRLVPPNQIIEALSIFRENGQNVICTIDRTSPVTTCKDGSGSSFKIS